MTTSPLVLGPMLRYVDETSASVWVETRATARVSIHAGGRHWEAGTFAVHGHHYALVELDGLEPGTVTPYSLDINGTHAWPEPEPGFPPSMVATLKPGRPLRMAYGSCRTSVPHNEHGNRTHGVDSLRAYALKMASDGDEPWPDLV
ncbi:MAG TPA: alkaline phosphatase family protein, partial [Arthrobacter sp.]